MKITYDPAKDASNLEKHGLSLEGASRLEWETVVAMPDCRREYGEIREVGYGLISDRLYCVVFAQRGDITRIISFRKANRREVFRYVRQTQYTITDH